MFYWFWREKKVERERKSLMWERNIHWLLPKCALTGDRTWNWCMYPDQDQTHNFLVYWTMLQSTEPPGKCCGEAFLLAPRWFYNLTRVQKHLAYANLLTVLWIASYLLLLWKTSPLLLYLLSPYFLTKPSSNVTSPLQLLLILSPSKRNNLSSP